LKYITIYKWNKGLWTKIFIISVKPLNKFVSNNILLLVLVKTLILY